MIQFVSFKGIAEPYKNSRGFYITPITKNPSQTEINDAVIATKVENPHSGMNGDAYFYGQDLVVKKYKPRGKALKFNPNREIQALDSLYENGITNPNIQQGLFAFTTPNDEAYLVSTKINGSKPSYGKNKFNRENLAEMVQLISDLDMPHRVENSKNFPYEVAIHYDLSPGNVLISEEKAGLIDFEYLEYDDLDKRIFGQMLGIKKSNSDFSDFAGIPSNLRNFESCTLYDYLLETPSDEAKYLFKAYLYEKAIRYHEKRAIYFSEQQEIAKSQKNEELSRLCEILADKEKCHAMLLMFPTEEIFLSEAMKIQMSQFIRMQSQYANSGSEKVNMKQINNYINNSMEFFVEMYRNSDDYAKSYYEDCIRLTQNWQAIIPRMQTKEKLVSEMPELSIPQEIAEYNSKHSEKYDTLQVFKSKLTNEHQKTLDEHLEI